MRRAMHAPNLSLRTCGQLLSVCLVRRKDMDLIKWNDRMVTTKRPVSILNMALRSSILMVAPVVESERADIDIFVN